MLTLESFHYAELRSPGRILSLLALRLEWPSAWVCIETAKRMA